MKEETTTDNLNVENLLHQAQQFKANNYGEKEGATKRITRHADPHIEPGKRNGKTYYYYRRGKSPIIYLGSADSILEAVMQTKLARQNNRGSYRS